MAPCPLAVAAHHLSLDSVQVQGLGHLCPVASAAHQHPGGDTPPAGPLDRPHTLVTHRRGAWPLWRPESSLWAAEQHACALASPRSPDSLLCPTPFSSPVPRGQGTPPSQPLLTSVSFLYPQAQTPACLQGACTSELCTPVPQAPAHQPLTPSCPCTPDPALRTLTPTPAPQAAACTSTPGATRPLHPPPPGSCPPHPCTSIVHPGGRCTPWGLHPRGTHLRPCVLKHSTRRAPRPLSGPHALPGRRGPTWGGGGTFVALVKLEKEIEVELLVLLQPRHVGTGGVGAGARAGARGPGSGVKVSARGLGFGAGVPA